MLFIETPLFTKQVQKLLDDERYRALQASLVIRPDGGELIRVVVEYERYVGQFQAKGSAAVCVLFITGTNRKIGFICCGYTKKARKRI